MTLVDFEEVVAEAVAVLGYVEDEETAKNYARQWIWRAKQKMSVSDQTIQVCEVTAKNLLLKKPKNLKSLLDIALFDASGSYLPHIFHQGSHRIYPNLEDSKYQVVNEDETVTYHYPIDLSETTTSYVIGTNGTNVAYALIRYYPLPLDVNNLPEVYEHEVDACVAYVRWRWSQRKNNAQSEIAQNKMDWMHECDWAKAKTKELDFSNEVKKRIASSKNRMIPNFNRSQF